MSINIKYTATASGNGKLLSENITEFVDNIPKKAELVVETKKALEQRDTDKWILTATWDETTQKTQPVLSYPPGVRGTGSTRPMGGVSD